MGGTPSVTGEVRHSLPVGVPPRQTGVAGPPPKTDALQPKPRAWDSGRLWHVGAVGYVWESCGNVGWDRKVPVRNAVRTVPVPAFPLPCHGT